MEFLPLKVDGIKTYAGFWKRFLSGLIDALIFIPTIFIFNYLIKISIPVAMFITVIQLSLYSIYSIYFNYYYGATIGKMVVGIKITSPDGSTISFKQVLLRSFVDISFAITFIVVQVIAISKANSDIFLNAGWLERGQYIQFILPKWYSNVSLVQQIWIWSEAFVVLFNKRKRAIHDFIANTVVIRAELSKKLESTEYKPSEYKPSELSTADNKRLNA
jgi:uncharacterized RDD family membrane protein YckC